MSIQRHLFRQLLSRTCMTLNTNLRCQKLSTGVIFMQSTDDGKSLEKSTSNLSSEKLNPSPPPQSNTFRWDNRTKLATIMMVLWFILCGGVMIKKHFDKTDQRHNIMLQQSMQYMSDKDKAQIQDLLEPKK